MILVDSQNSIKYGDIPSQNDTSTNFFHWYWYHSHPCYCKAIRM